MAIITKNGIKIIDGWEGVYIQVLKFGAQPSKALTRWGYYDRNFELWLVKEGT